eukprot:Gregarina_sp_Poly_1__9075@NODE_554_length_7547_cov_65_763102_g165_i1_p3_GENE_NODE_554_length_7547_cov_65_763102_g165_i1NODE_554_length_7547_cov_65_763102_g165_i1_p3_ORF_typecomplete_len287_score50_24_NODE_554_length_7547_cov_65_763102_g165_i163297189
MCDSPNQSSFSLRTAGDRPDVSLGSPPSSAPVFSIAAEPEYEVASQLSSDAAQKPDVMVPPSWDRDTSLYQSAENNAWGTQSDLAPAKRVEDAVSPSSTRAGSPQAPTGSCSGGESPRARSDSPRLLTEDKEPVAVPRVTNLQYAKGPTWDPWIPSGLNNTEQSRLGRSRSWLSARQDSISSVVEVMHSGRLSQPVYPPMELEPMKSEDETLTMPGSQSGPASARRHRHASDRVGAASLAREIRKLRHMLAEQQNNRDTSCEVYELVQEILGSPTSHSGQFKVNRP